MFPLSASVSSPTSLSLPPTNYYLIPFQHRFFLFSWCSHLYLTLYTRVTTFLRSVTLLPESISWLLFPHSLLATLRSRELITIFVFLCIPTRDKFRFPPPRIEDICQYSTPPPKKKVINFQIPNFSHAMQLLSFNAQLQIRNHQE